jgi:hypothetical protein
VVAVLGPTSFSYLNTNQVSTASGGITANTNPIYIGLDSSLEMFKGKLAVVKVYNKALTIQEIKTNFEATRGRYGI